MEFYQYVGVPPQIQLPPLSLPISSDVNKIPYVMTLQLTKQNLLKLVPQKGSLNARGRAKSPTPSVVSFKSNTSRRSASVGSVRASRGRFRGRGRSRGRGVVRSMRPRLGADAVRHVMRKITPHVALIKRYKSTYFDQKDFKDTPLELKAAQAELEMARAMLRAGMGDKPIHVRMTATFTLAVNAGATVVNVVVIGAGDNRTNPSVCTEWSSAAALFDEYKQRGGSVHFRYGGGTVVQYNGNGASYANLTGANDMVVIAFDPADSVAATLSTSLTELSQHKILENVAVFSGNTTLVFPGSGDMHKFNWHIPPGVELNTGTAVGDANAWISVDSPVANGAIKFVHTASNVTANINRGTGICYMNLQFRCRE